MTALPWWRSLDPASGSARLVAIGSIAVLFALLASAVAAPLFSQYSDARERAARLDTRSAALQEAAALRRREAGTAQADPAELERAETWLSSNAPARNEEAALLDLISAIRLIAEATDVRLQTATPLNLGRSGQDLKAMQVPDMAGLSVSMAEMRLTTDHAGLARFLTAIETAEPTLRAFAIEISARSTTAIAETDRLAVKMTIGALSRADRP